MDINEYYKNMNKFKEEYKALLNKDIYIEKEMFDEIIYKYHLDITDDKELSAIYSNINRDISHHNEKYITDKLVKYNDYFDKMFSNIDPNIILDIEQRKIIISDEKNSLVIAGAGSGKTTTMATKVKYLVDKKSINPKKILILAFTNQATIELKNRINNQFNIPADIMTFHKLGLKIIKNAGLNKMTIITDEELETVIEKFLLEFAFPKKEYLKKIITSFKKYLHFTNKITKYEKFTDYYDNYIKNLYLRHLVHIKQYNKDKIAHNLKMWRSIEGNRYLKPEHILISNYLFTNNIPYDYYYGEFRIFNSLLSDYEQNLRTLPSLNHRNNLNKSIFKNITETVIWYKKSQNIYNYLQKLNQFFEEKSDSEIFYTIMQSNKKELYHDFVILIKSFFIKFKNKGFTITDFDSLIIKNIKLKDQLEIIKDIYIYYESYKQINNKIDFQDMIMLATKNVSSISWNYQYMIIDEYQDISWARYRLIRKISDTFKTKILAVGDDFQAIYSFSGSEVNLFTDFYDLMGFASIHKITKTYRNSQELIDIAGMFVMKNEEQIKKELISKKRINNPVILAYYKNDKSEKLYTVIHQIIKENKNSKILLLGRYKHDIFSVVDNVYFKKIENKLLCIKLDLKLDFMTIHASKGLGYDDVVILNFENSLRGFPSQIEDEDIIKILSSSKTAKLYLEERRLFYVALTRTKHKVYILCPKESEKQSVFKNEIVGGKGVLEIK